MWMDELTERQFILFFKKVQSSFLFDGTDLKEKKNFSILCIVIKNIFYS